MQHDFTRFAAARDRLSAGREGPGVVYVIVNDTFAGLVKVGYSKRSGHARASELNDQRYTGTPGSYSCVFELRVRDAVAVERAAHQELAGDWVGREWFRCEVDNAVRVLRRLADAESPVRATSRATTHVVRQSNGASLLAGRKRLGWALDVTVILTISIAMGRLIV
jgi:hypothetical protein